PAQDRVTTMAHAHGLGSGRRLQLRFAAITLGTAVANFAVIALFLSRILVWDGALWPLFFAVASGWMVALFALAQRMQRTRRVLAHWLDHPDADEAGTCAAFAAAADVTREVVANSFLLWPFGALMVGLTMRLLSPAVT